MNEVTKELFRKYRKAEDYAEASREELEEAIRPTGFFRNKAKAIRACCQDLSDHHGGRVPETMEALTRLAGVGRKTANVVLGNAFGKDEGVVVDTHVGRLARRLRLTRERDPSKAERDLMKVVPRQEWTLFAHLFIRHGRRTCTARSPDCPGCPVGDLCPSKGKV